MRVPLKSDYVRGKILPTLDYFRRSIVPNPLLQSGIYPAHVVRQLPYYIASNLEPNNVIHDWFASVSYRSKFITVEDKDPSVIWLHDPAGLFCRWFRNLVQSPSRWRVVQSCPEASLYYFRVAYECSLPPDTQRSKDYKTAISHRHLPYAAPSAKRKCWDMVDGAVEHRCTDSIRSCYRNII